MALEFVGIDPNTDRDHCPTVWVDPDAQELLIQGWEHYVTHANVTSGEQVRWLPRRLTTDLALPGNDFWAFDESVLRVHHFSGDGAVVEDEITADSALVTHCVTAFESVWERATPHDQYGV